MIERFMHKIYASMCITNPAKLTEIGNENLKKTNFLIFFLFHQKKN